MPGAAVRFDYQSLDSGANRLYISHMDAGHIVVFDVQAERVVDTVGGLPRVTGVLAVPELGYVYASVTSKQVVAVINDTTLQVVTQIGPIGFPDGLAYAPGQQKVYVSDESGGGELVIDGRANRAVTTIPIGGHAGNTVYDAGSGCILVAVQDQNQIVAIDPRSDRVVSRFSPANASYPHGMLVDAQRRLLFVANDNSASLSILDLRTLRALGSQPLGTGPDVLAFDPVWRRLYVGSESGVVSVFTELDTALVAEGSVTIPYAHTVAVDPRSHLVYLPLQQDAGGQPMLWIMAGTPPTPAGPVQTRGVRFEPGALALGYADGF
jgi:DNA-binding beta-propeller fold protein YncE